MRIELEALALVFLGACTLAASLNESSTDESSLVAFKARLNSDVLAKNWSKETPFCSWIGVTCSEKHARVTSLDLSSMDIRGSIPPEIGNLSFLTYFNLSNNTINGLTPSQVGSLRRLRVLDMASNKLSDGIPEELGLLGKLAYLDLSFNRLSGDIPTSLSACDQLNVLDLSGNALTGSIPRSFGNLSHLQLFSTSQNQITGELPATLFNISSLIALEVGGNQMSGSIPNNMCNVPTKLQSLVLAVNQFEGEVLPILTRCRSLTSVFLRRNNFSGTIPGEIWNMSAMVSLTLGGNAFTGTLSPAILNMSNLVMFDISENTFHGNIPSEIGNLSTLQFLNLRSNKLGGEVQQSIFNLTRLQFLSLALNNLSGSLPVSIDEGLPNIDTFTLGGNLFHGKIPTSISNLSRLTVLELSINAFTGLVPTSLGNLGRLQSLGVSENQLTNNLSNPEQDFLSSLSSCKDLSFIHIAKNPITGLLPKTFASGNLSVSLERFVATSCKIQTPLPIEIGNFSNLVWLNLGYNDLTGTIPVALRSLGKLQKLEINGNKLHGSISSVLCNMTNLFSVDFSENNFSGQIPGCLGDLPSLGEINLAYNAFGYNIPSSLWSSDSVERMNMSNNLINGSLPREIGDMKTLIDLDLSWNQIHGEIPGTISKLQKLATLALSNNKLDGPLNDSFSDLKALEYLDLSYNDFSGPIPKSWEKLTHLSYLNVSFNNLTGEIPEGGSFAKFTSDSSLDNRGLCGAPRFNVEECKRSNPAHSRKTKILKYILPAIVSALAAAFVLFLILKNRSGKLSPSSPPEVPPRVHERITYQEILHATRDLSEENLIGRGSFASVYKGYFSDKTVAAVKIFDLDVQGALVSFDIECQILRSIRHRNLVKVITSCSNLDFKALVLEFMPNGNLGKWLYSADCYLNISQRLEIMVDVAAALEYLHDGSPSPIVHCDLKPQNILLDENMLARVGDFGISKLLTQEQRMHQTRTLGTIGYMAPEYGSEGLVSTKVDVYSYGILLMEMCSRRKPTDDMFSGELTMRIWVQESFPNSVEQVADSELLNIDDKSRRVEYERCLASTIELALECTADMPEERPRMKDVLVRIKKVESNLSNKISIKVET